MVKKLLLILCFTLCASAYAVESNDSNDVNDESSLLSESSVLDANTNKVLAVQAMESSVVVENVENVQDWEYSIKDKYVSTMFSKWAKLADYQLIWQATGDFEIQSSGQIKDSTFKGAVNDILRSFKYTDHPLKAEWYKNNVLVISDF